LNHPLVIDNGLQQLMIALLNSRMVFWLLLALPGAFAVSDFSGGARDAMDMLRPTGEWSARLLIVALAITPLMGLTRGAAWVRWLAARRRWIGVAAFLYALAHLGFYVVDMGSLDMILGEALLLGIWTGWAAFFAMVAMAVTSNDAAMRRLKAGWKRLQRLAYPAVLLTLVHWLVVHDGFVSALLHAVPLVLLELHRFYQTVRKVPRHA
jgi:sulfoxide reductase heme-binding subunit YedZ